MLLFHILCYHKITLKENEKKTCIHSVVITGGKNNLYVGAGSVDTACDSD